jgi:hypothetical protein
MESVENNNFKGQLVLKNSDLSWDTVCAFLSVLKRYNKNPYMRTKTIEKFIETCMVRDSHDAHEVFRLVLPKNDSKRGYYGLNEFKLIYQILAAIGRQNDDALFDTLYNWRKKSILALALGEPEELSELLREKVFDLHCGIRPKDSDEGDISRRKLLKVKDVNEKLDSLHSFEGSADGQIEIIKWFIERTTPQQMMWLVQVILRNVKVALSEHDVLECWSNDAVDQFYDLGWSLEEVLDGAPQYKESKPSSYVLGKEMKRQSDVYLASMRDAYTYMERRFKEEWKPLEVVAEAMFDGIRVQIHRHAGAIHIFPLNRKFTEGSWMDVLSTFLAEMAPEASGDFVLEAEIAAWNTSKECFEPSFVLESILKQCGKIQNGFQRVLCDAYPSYKPPEFADVEILCLVSDLLWIGDTIIVNKAFEIRLESLIDNIQSTIFDRKNDIGFPIRVKVLPMIPGKATMHGIPLSILTADIDEMYSLKSRLELIGASGISLRALEPTWNSPHKFSTVHIPNIMGKVILTCMILGMQKNPETSRVSRWVLGIKSSDATQPPMSIANVKNTLHIDDETKIMALLGDAVKHDGEKNAVDFNRKLVNMSIAANIIPSGRWSDIPLVHNVVLLGMAPTAQTASCTTVAELENMIALQRDKSQSRPKSPIYFKSKGRTVASKFLPCDVANVHETSSILKDEMIYFVNYTPPQDDCETNEISSWRKEKETCEKLVKQLGGRVSQNFGTHVTLVVAGHPDFVTEHLMEQDIAIVKISWLKNLLFTATDTLPAIVKESQIDQWKPRKDTAHSLGVVLPPAMKSVPAKVPTKPKRSEIIPPEIAASPPKKPKTVGAFILPNVDAVNQSSNPEPFKSHPAPSISPSKPTPTTQSPTVGKPKLSLKERAKLLGLGKK